MAYANDIRNASGVSQAGFVERLVNGVKSFFDGGAQRRVYRQTVRELNALSARDLTDLGIHRSMIEKLAYEAAYGK